MAAKLSRLSSRFSSHVTKFLELDWVSKLCWSKSSTSRSADNGLCECCLEPLVWWATQAQHFDYMKNLGRRNRCEKIKVFKRKNSQEHADVIDSHTNSSAAQFSPIQGKQVRKIPVSKRLQSFWADRREAGAAGRRTCCTAGGKRIQTHPRPGSLGRLTCRALRWTGCHRGPVGRSLRSRDQLTCDLKNVCQRDNCMWQKIAKGNYVLKSGNIWLNLAWVQILICSSISNILCTNF